MKILIFCPYYPPHIGGLESHSDEFNKYLSRRGMDISVFTPRLPKNSLEFEIKHKGVKIIRFPAFEIIANYPLPKFWSLKFWSLFFGLFGEKFDLVLSRTRFFNTSLLALTYAKIKKVYWIHIEHGSDFVRLSSRFKSIVAKIYDFTFGFLIFKFSDLNISISEAVQKFIYKFDERKSPIVYRGIETETLEKIPADLEFKKKYADKIIIVWHGRLYGWKGVKNSLRAVNDLPEEIKKKIVFIIIGDGEDSGKLKKNADGPIIFTGSLPREKTIGILKASDIYIHSSEPGGGLSTSLIEAMFSGCAIIATPNEGANEIIADKKTGWLVKKSDPKLIAEKIKMLVENEEKIKICGQAAKHSIKNKFNWEKTTDIYERIFKNEYHR